MNPDLQNIKDLFNSASNQNLYMAWHMLKNHKEYGKGEFRDTLMLMFYTVEAKNSFHFVLKLEGSSIHGFTHKYKIGKKEVFSYRVQFQNIKLDHRKRVPMEFYQGQKKAIFNKVCNYIESLLLTF